MQQKEIADFFDEEKTDPQLWILNAAKDAKQLFMSTHPCTFSHPGSRKINKKEYVTPIIAKTQKANDGYLRTGNVNVQTDTLENGIDTLGNAAKIKVFKFLNLSMNDGLKLIDHIKKDSNIAKEVLSSELASYEELKDGFLEVYGNDNKNITSSKIKQVYFPIENDQYHLLSLLTNSGILFHMRHTIDRLRFGDEVKALRELKRENKASETGFMEIYDITTIGFGGTKPQNISVLNNQNGGKAHLLSSMPPVIKKREVRFPKRNFFGESVRAWELRETFTALDKIFKTGYNNKNIREGREYRYEQIIDTIILRLYSVREAAKEQYIEKNSQLKSHQKIWLLDEERRWGEDEWLEKLLKEITAWFVRSFEEIVGKKIIVYGKAEKQSFVDLLERHKEALR